MKIRAIQQWWVGAAIAVATWSGPLAGNAAGTVARVLTHEGRLLDADGAPLVEPTRVTFTLYDAASGGRPVWSEAQDVDFDDGYFSVRLGEVTPLAPALLDGTTRWLGLAVGADPERSARTPVVGKPAPSPERPAGTVVAAVHADAELGPLRATADRTFLGATIRMPVEPAQHVHVSASAGLGSTAPGGAHGLHLSICARPVAATRLVDNPPDRQADLRIPENGQQTFSLRTRFTALPPGEYEFGLCARVDGTSQWNHNGTSRVALLVLAQ